MVRARRIGGFYWGLILIGLAFSGCVALTGETAGETVDDTVITTEVKAKLVGEKILHTTRVGVKTERGVVYLTGVVETAEERAQIKKIVGGVRGVREVVDHLEVRP